MKKFILACTLIAAFAALGCGSEDTSSKTSTPSENSSAKVSNDFEMTENVKKTLQEKNITIVKQYVGRTKVNLITEFSDGSFVMDKISEVPKFSESTGAKLGHFHK